MINRLNTPTAGRIIYAGKDVTNLSGADLTRAILEEADLSGADLTDAHLSGADLTRVRLEGAHLSGATMPDGSIHD
jgi:uncharacterized protein YjbI with pentapeptide repeats